MRWSEEHNKDMDYPRVDYFLAELKEFCKEHELCIRVRGMQGGLSVEAYDKGWIDELEGATVGESSNRDYLSL